MMMKAAQSKLTRFLGVKSQCHVNVTSSCNALTSQSNQLQCLLLKNLLLNYLKITTKKL